MVVAHSKVVGAEATRVASYFPDAQSARGTGQSSSILKEEDAMKPSTKDQAEGKFHEVKGKIKEKAGKATNNPNLENEGTNEKTAGKVQKKIGQVEKVLGD
jgi:uncharacterized protein YjbJ (UPF0337 family)